MFGVEPLEDLARRQRRRARRCKLDGQGYAVELPAQLRHRVGGLEDDTRVGGSLEEQPNRRRIDRRSEEHTSELQSLMRNSYAGFCFEKKNNTKADTKHKQS